MQDQLEQATDRADEPAIATTRKRSLTALTARLLTSVLELLRIFPPTGGYYGGF
jgi:hypothetical protein